MQQPLIGSMESFLNVNKLSVTYPGKSRKVLNSVSFTLRKGEILGIVGESGSGKTTLASSIINILPPGTKKEGEIIYRGRDVLKMNEKELRNIRGGEISIVFQDPAASFNPVLTVGYHFYEFMRKGSAMSKNSSSNKRDRSAIVDGLLKRVGIYDTKRVLGSYPHQLSGGQLQRAMIALAISNNPDILIADEPTSSLDVTVESQIINLLLGLRKELGFTILFITHNLGLIKVLCDRVVFLHKGKVEEITDAETLFLSARSGQTKSFINDYLRLIS